MNLSQSARALFLALAVAATMLAQDTARCSTTAQTVNGVDHCHISDTEGTAAVSTNDDLPSLLTVIESTVAKTGDIVTAFATVEHTFPAAGNYVLLVPASNKGSVLAFINDTIILSIFSGPTTTKFSVNAGDTLYLDVNDAADFATLTTSMASVQIQPQK